MTNIMTNVFCLSAVLVLTATEVKGECHVGDTIYQDGDEFSLPGSLKCIKYRCSHNVYSVVSEGCEVEGECHKVGVKFEHDCITYRCVKKVQSQSTLYITKHISTICTDSNGQCRSEGEIFPDVIKQRFYQKCKCKVTGPLATSLWCTD